MRSCMLTVFAAVAAVVLTAGTLCAEEAKPLSEQEVAALESGLFVNVDAMDTSDEAKFAQQLIAESGDDQDAKCWFWCWRYPRWYYYPTYYYYSWYCPCYYVRFRIVTYTIPTVTAETTTVAATATTATTTETTTASVASTTIIAKSSGKVAKGAVIDQKVPSSSPLRKMGLRAGDIVTNVDGNPVQSLLDVRRIKSNSNITYVRGNQIRVAGKPLLQKATESVAKSFAGSEQSAVNTNDIKNAQSSTMSLYEYYDGLENASNVAPAEQTEEYGASEY